MLSSLKYEWTSGALEGKYILKTPDLHQLELFSKLQENYPATLKGKIAYLPVLKMLKLSGDTKLFGGDISYFYRGNNLRLKLQKISVQIVEKLLQTPLPFTKNSKLQGVINFQDLIHHKGNFKLILKGVLSKHLLKSLYDIDLEDSLDIKLTSSGKFQEDMIQARSAMQTKLGNIICDKINYQLSSKNFNGEYQLKVPNLKLFKSLTHYNYRGSLNINGKIDSSEKLHLNGISSDWGGSTVYSLDSDIINIKTIDTDLSKIMWTLNIMPLLNGKLQSNLIYNLSTKEGRLKASSKNISLNSGSFSEALSILLHKDITQYHFKETLFDARIEAETIYFDFIAKSPSIVLDIKDGKIDRQREHIDAILRISIKNNTYNLKITGSLKNMKLRSVTGQILQRRVSKIIKNRNIKKKIKKVINKTIKNKSHNIKTILEGLF